SANPVEPTYFNGAAAVARGIEAGLRSSLGPRFEADVSYTYLFAEATEDAAMPSATFAAGEPLIRRPSHSAELGVTGRPWDRLTLGGSVTLVGSREDVDFNQFPSVRVRLPAYALLGLAGEVQVVRNLSAVGRVENLLDEQYDEVVGFPGRPRAFFGGARFHF
ncbi:MAG TPA: TonB-dependent receptor, partial [Gemmatimonadales bacterium]